MKHKLLARYCYDSSENISDADHKDGWNYDPHLHMPVWHVQENLTLNFT
jgi:hypothetical protein